MTYRALFKFNKMNTQNISTNHTALPSWEGYLMQKKAGPPFPAEQKVEYWQT